MRIIERMTIRPCLTACALALAVAGSIAAAAEPAEPLLRKCGIYHIAYFATDDGEMPIVYLSMPKIEIVPESAP